MDDYMMYSDYVRSSVDSLRNQQERPPGSVEINQIPNNAGSNINLDQPFSSNQIDGRSAGISDSEPRKTRRQIKEECNAMLDDDPYFSYNIDPLQPITRDEIYAIFQDVCLTFGFQEHNCENTFELFMSQLDSKSSRMPPIKR